MTIALAMIFSIGCFSEDVLPPIGCTGREYPGDSGTVLPGDGADFVKITTISTTERTGENRVSDAVNEETQTNYTNDTKEGYTNVNELLIAFWHGVATVLIGETVALMVAVAWLKIGVNKREF